MISCPNCGIECELPARQCGGCSYWFPIPEIAHLKDTHTRAQLEEQARALSLRHLGDDLTKDYLAARIATAE